jgi:hypothetical protein
MRYVGMVLIAFSLLPAGCSALIAGTGFDLGTLETKEQVHAKFGMPAKTGVSEGQSFESFLSRVKFRDDYCCSGCLMCCGMTLGLSEFLAFPGELGWVGWNTLFGQDVRFTYDQAGQVEAVLVDGRSVSMGKIPNVVFNVDDAGKISGVSVDGDPVKTQELPIPPTR